jgi:zinc transport system permease protein
MISFWQEAFFWRAFICALSVAMVAGTVGCFVVWRRLAYFGDTLAHSGLLGVTIAILLNGPLYLCLAGLGMLIGILLLKLQKQNKIGSDTLLGILAHGALATGLVLLSLMDNNQINVLGLLYGDILTLSNKDVLITVGSSTLILALMIRLFSPLLRITVNPSLAAVEGVKVERYETLFVLTIAISVAVAIKIVGVLLITALLIIPAASARLLSKSPVQMAVLSALIGSISVVMGLLSSFSIDIPTGPAIVVFACIVFMGCLVVQRLLQ